MSDRIRYPAASYPGVAAGSNTSTTSSERQEQLAELARSIPDCISDDAQRRKWRLQVLLPHNVSPTGGVQTVTMELDVPLDYPSRDAELRVTPIIQHWWVNESTGVFDPGEQSARKTLKQLMLDGYEALSGTRYVSQTPANGMSSFVTSTGGTGDAIGSVTAPSTTLRSQIQSKLQSLGDEELFKLITDPQAFMGELQSWLRDTQAGKKHVEVHRSLLQAAQGSKDLVAEYEGTEQQVRVTQSGEVQPSMHEHDELLAKQAALLSKVDLDAMIQSMITEASRMDTADAEKAEILSRGASEPWDQYVLSAKLDGYKQKRQAYHEAAARSQAAAQLTSSIAR